MTGRVVTLQRLLDLDAQLTGQLRISEQARPVRGLAILLAHSGDSWFWLVGLVVLWLLGSDLWKWRAAVMLLAILLTAVAVLIIKFTVRRRRPEGEWGGIYRKTDPHSFPSGHAARAAMLAVLSLAFGPAWFGILMVIWALLVMMARVAMGVHYVSDVAAGGIFGVLIGLAICFVMPV
jgi:membrane-associated phospholipid phosphatase